MNLDLLTHAIGRIHTTAQSRAGLAINQVLNRRLHLRIRTGRRGPGRVRRKGPGNPDDSFEKRGAHWFLSSKFEKFQAVGVGV